VPSSSSPLEIRLFGPFEARVNGEPLPRLRSRKTRWLLGLLALRAGREMERLWLAFHLWPDSPESAAMTSLRSSLKDLRQALGPAQERIWSPTPHTLSLEADTSHVDLLAFDAAMARGEPGSPARYAGLEEAVSLYRGPLLDGCLEPWAFEARREREEAYLSACETLAARAMAGEEWTAAERHLRRVVALDPLREGAQRALMETLAAAGSYAAALLVYRELRLRLHDELSTEPDTETQALFQRLQSDARRRAHGAAVHGGAAGERGLPASFWDGPIDDEPRVTELLLALEGGPTADWRPDHATRGAPDDQRPTTNDQRSTTSEVGRTDSGSWAVPPSALAALDLLEPVGGAVPLDSPFYVARPVDALLARAIARRDSIVLIKGARQMGKTSLLARGLHQARRAGARVLRTDFQTLNARQLESLDTLFLQLADSIADQLDLDEGPEEAWRPHGGPSANFQRYWRRVVLRSVEAPIVWGLDEIDRLFATPFAGEVFGLFRSWHNDRALDPEGPWRRLTLALAYATEASLFITDVHQSPFNVGTSLELEDFTPEQVAGLNERYGSPLRNDEERERFIDLVGGHPYLVRRGLHEMVLNDLDLATLEAQAERDRGVFGDHLRRILVLLARDADLCDALRAVLQGRPCPPDERFYRLRSAGLLLGDAAEEARPRCRLYAAYLSRRLL
jgi:DNA-binding SARP family transcriptional activator